MRIKGEVTEASPLSTIYFSADGRLFAGRGKLHPGDHAWLEVSDNYAIFHGFAMDPRMRAGNYLRRLRRFLP